MIPDKIIVPKTWEERLQIIEQINSLDLKEASIEDIAVFIAEMSIGQESSPFHLPEGTIFFRAIKWDEKPMLWENIIYPPKEKAEINRASDKGEQVFYSSTVKKTVFYETEMEIGKRYIISKWVNDYYLLSLQHIGYNNDEILELGQLYHSPFDFRKLPVLSESNIKLQEYFKNTFSRKIENLEDYKLTIAIGKKHYDSNIDFKSHMGAFDGLIYHTTRLENYAANILLKKEVINEKIVKFDSVEYVEILDKIGDTYTYQLLDYANYIKDGIIQWKELKRTWIFNDESDDVVFNESGSDYDFYTLEGEIIPSSG